MNTTPVSLSRRLLAAGLLGLALLGMAGVTPARAAAPKVEGQAPGFYRTTLGDVEITALSDGTHAFPVTTVMQGVTPKQLEAALRYDFLAPPVAGSINAFLINTGKRLVLIDSGAGLLYGDCCGRLQAHLRAAGYAPEQIDAVYLTHLHKDHVGGITRNGVMQFPNATIYVSAHELAYWTSPAAKAAAPDFLSSFFDAAVAALQPYQQAGRVRTIEAPGPLADDGLEAIATPGHTPGHLSYVLHRGDQTLVVWGDIVHVASLQLPRPEITVKYDSDAAAARRSRTELAGQVVQRRYLVAAAHVAFPGLGHLRRAPQGRGYEWVPLNYDEQGGSPH